jgi:aspartate aminotransferase
LPALRDAIAAHYRNWQGLRLVPDDVVVGPGSKGLIFLLQLAFDGEVLIPTPGWVSYAPQAELLGHRVRGIPTAGSDGWRLDPETLDRLCEKMPRRPRLLILNYPLNPSGTTLGATRLRALAEVARKHELLVLSDEIYGRLQHRGKHHSIARFYPEGTIVSGGLSKWAGAGGWRLGHLAFPKHLRALRETVTAAASESFTSTCAPVQYAAEAAYTREHATRPYLDAVRAVLGSLARELVARLRRARVDVATPEGGFYLFPSFAPLRGRLAQRGIHDDRELCRSIETTCAVGLVPGSKFGRSPTELTARLAYVDFDGEAALRSASWRMSAGTPLDAEWVHAYCGPTEDGVSRICAWLDGD